MPRRPTSDAPEAPLRLLVTREHAAARIGERIAIGEALLEHPIRSTDELEAARHDRTKWSQYNHELLKQLFSTPAMAEEYSRFLGAVVMGGPTSLGDKVDTLHRDIRDSLHRLDSIRARLDLIPFSTADGGQAFTPATRPSETAIFIVHGQDEAARESVARFAETLDLDPIILHEQVNAGRTIIEKLEHYANVPFAIVLLTPDDIGASASSPDSLQPRARQNVILELGYFVGLLGRAHVCALYKGSLELPSDYVGVVYIPLDPEGGWRLRLAKELKAAGFGIDMNRAL
jgi:predicted nucleotide-binding protein